MPPKKFEKLLNRTPKPNVRILGGPGVHVGDVVVFEAQFFEGVTPFSSETGVQIRVGLPEVWLTVVTHKWPKGDLTVQFLDDFAQTPAPAEYRFAITGGTGDYKGAHGEITYVDDGNITFRFSTH